MWGRTHVPSHDTSVPIAACGTVIAGNTAHGVRYRRTIVHSDLSMNGTIFAFVRLSQCPNVVGASTRVRPTARHTPRRSGSGTPSDTSPPQSSSASRISVTSLGRKTPFFSFERLSIRSAKLN